MEITKEDIRLYRQFQKSPIFFIEKNWGLVPQPLKPEFQDLAQTARLDEFKPTWFQPFIKGKHITWQQWLILLAVEKAIRGEAPKRISIRSGHGIGKTATMAWLIYWFLFCHKDAQIPCTAPTAEQMHDILWKEVAIWQQKFLSKDIADLFEWQSGYVRVKERPETWFARAKTARKENPEALAGVHGDHVLYLVDEASGVPDVIFNTAEGALTGDVFFFIMISNATRLIGYFHASHTSDKENWQTLHFNSEESPIVKWDYVDRIEQKHGKDSDEYRVRVSGDFPKSDAVDDKGFVPLLKAEDIKTIEDCDLVGYRRLGIDPSGAGKDKASWVARDNFKIKPLLQKGGISDPKSIAQPTLTLWDHHEIDPEDTWIDNFGVGANVAVELLKAKKDAETNPVNFGDSPDDKELFANKKAEMFWRMRKFLTSGGAVVKNALTEEFIKQLLSIRWRRNMQNKIEIMKKEDMRKLGFPSPDLADGGALTFYEEDNEDNIEEYKQPDYEEQYPGSGV